jgi:hypothetical protein
LWITRNEDNLSKIHARQIIIRWQDWFETADFSAALSSLLDYKGYSANHAIIQPENYKQPLVNAIDLLIKTDKTDLQGRVLPKSFSRCRQSNFRRGFYRKMIDI